MKNMIVLALLTAIAAPASAQTIPAAPPPKCDTPHDAEFDFWVGDWDVSPRGVSKVVAHSKIEKLYNGCAVRENWKPLNGNDGGSLNNYDPTTGQWQQVWIGSSPGRVEYSGGLVDGKMVLTAFLKDANGPGKNALSRMIFSKEADGSVRQYGQQSNDQGLTWADSFDFIYRRSAAP